METSLKTKKKNGPIHTKVKSVKGYYKILSKFNSNVLILNINSLIKKKKMTKKQQLYYLLLNKRR